MFCSRRCYRGHTGETQLEARIREQLECMPLLDFVQEFPCGRYNIDFALPSYHIALEVDGAYWHQDIKKEKRRDAYLHNHGWIVVHLQERDILHASNLQQFLIRMICEHAPHFMQPALPFL
jgi:very-short-patch-repair endonuclease